MDMKKRGQVTLFIILGVVIVVGITSLFIFTRGVEEVNTPENLGPRGFIDSCVKDAVEDSIEKVMAGGGEISPSFTITEKEVEYNYLCHYAGNYYTCYNLHPMLRKQAEAQIKTDTNDKVQDCFDALREDFENRGYEVVGNETNYTIEILPGEVRINLEKSIQIGTDSVQHFENFDTKIISSLYDLIKITNDIVRSEAQFCYFEKNGFMLLYPQYNIIDEEISEGSVLYQVIDRNSNESFKFAVRGCVFPSGLY